MDVTNCCLLFLSTSLHIFTLFYYYIPPLYSPIFSPLSLLSSPPSSPPNSNGGTFVTYANSSRLHLKITPSSLIFNDVEFRGFDLGRWNESNTKEEREKMVKEVGGLLEGGKVKVSVEKVGFGEWKEALEKAAGGENVVLVM